MQLTVAIVLALAAVAGAFPNGYASSDYAPSSYAATSDYAPASHSGSHAQADHTGSKSHEDSSKPKSSHASLSNLDLNVGTLGLGPKPADLNRPESTLRTPSQLKGGSEPTIAVGEPNHFDDGIPLSDGTDSRSGDDAIKLENGGAIPEDVSTTKPTEGASKPADSIVDSTSKEKDAAQLVNGGSKLGNGVPKPAVGGNPPADVSGPKSTNGAAQIANSIVDSTSKEHISSHPVNGGSQSGSEAIKPAVSSGAPIGVPGSKSANGAIQPTSPVTDNASKEHIGSQPVDGGLKSTNEAVKPDAGANVPVNVNGAKSANGPAQSTSSIVDSTSKGQPVSQAGSGATGASKYGNEAIKPASGGNVPVKVNGPNTNGAAQSTNSIVDSTSKGQPVSQAGGGASSSGNELTKTAVGGNIPIDVTGPKSTNGDTQPIKPVVDNPSKENVGSQLGQGGSNSGHGAINPAVGVNVPVNANVPKSTTGTVQPIESVVDSTSKPNVGSQLGNGVSNSAGADIEPDQTIQVDTSGKDSGKGDSQPGLVNVGAGSTSDEKVRPKTGHPKPSIVHGAYKQRHSDSKANQGGSKLGHTGSSLLGLDLGAGSKVGSKNDGDKSTPVSGSRPDSHIGTKSGSDHEASKTSSESTRDTYSAHHGYTKSDYA